MSRSLAGLAAAGLLAWLAWQVIMTVSPRHLEGGSGTSIAVAPGARSADLVRQLEARIAAADETVDWAAISRTARNILRTHPLESRALFVLGLAAEADGRDVDAVALIDLAAARSLRDRGAHFWLFSHQLGKREFGPAVDHADVLLRTRPQLKATLLPALMAVASTAEGRIHLAGLFKADHPWRSWFLRAFSKAAGDPSDPSPLYAALQAGSNPPGSAELRPHLDRLIAAGRFEQAFAIWKTSLAPDELRDLDGLHNGEFERPISHLPFDWLVSQPRGAEIDVSESPLATGMALRVQFARARVPFRHVRKLVMLSPGTYRLRGLAKAHDLRNDRGLVWTLTCAEGTHEPLARTARVTGSMTAEIMQQFSVPPQDCGAQWLQLELAARIPPEQDVDGGTVWYDSLRIRPVDADHPSASASRIRH